MALDRDHRIKKMYITNLLASIEDSRSSTFDFGFEDGSWSIYGRVSEIP